MNTDHCILMAVVDLVLGAPPVGGCSSSGARDELRKEYERIRAASQPLTRAELDAWYSAQTPNSADSFLEAFAAQIAPSEDMKIWLPSTGRDSFPPRGQALPEQARKSIRQLVEQNGRALELLRRDTGGGPCRYPENFEVLDTGPFLRQVRNAARLLTDAAILYGDTERPDDAVQCLIRTLQIAQTVEQEPTIVSQLVRIACVQYVVEAANWVANRGVLSDSQLLSLSSAISAAEASRGYYYGYVGERCFFGTLDPELGPGCELLFKEMTQREPRGPKDLSLDQLMAHSRSPYLPSDLLLSFRILDALIRSTDGPIENADPAIQEAQKLVDGAASEPSRYFFTSLIARSLVRCHLARQRMVASCRIAIAGLGVKRYLLRKGQFPASLDELVPDCLPSVPKDPFGGAPLRFSVRDGSCVVYSISHNLRDDGGVEVVVGNRALTEGDIVFIVTK